MANIWTAEDASLRLHEPPLYVMPWGELLAARDAWRVDYERLSRQALLDLLVKIEDGLSGDRRSMGLLIDSLDEADRDLLFSSFSELLGVVARRFEEAAAAHATPTVRDLLRGVRLAERPGGAGHWASSRHFAGVERDLIFRLANEDEALRQDGLAPRLAALERAYDRGLWALIAHVGGLALRRVFDRS
jgi:hypothetical protein